MLNLVQQIRATLLAAKITPQEFYDAFKNTKAQDQFFIDLHVIQDTEKMKEMAAGAQDSPVGGDSTLPKGIT